jgi:hypothetical protein
MQSITKIPNLLLVGAPKCGTTSLLYWMRQHPEIYHPWAHIPISASESGFLLGGIADHPYSPTKPIGTLLLPNEINMDNYKNQKWIIDKSPQHLYSSKALDSVTNLLPDSRVIITLRNPVDLLISWHGEMNKGIDYDVSFQELIEMIEKEHWEANIEKPDTWPFLTYPQYSNFVNSWIENLGVERVKVIKLSSIANNPKKVLDSLCEWLDLDQTKMPHNLSIKNQGGKLSNNPLRKFLRRPPKFVFTIVRIFIPSRNIRKIILDPIRRMGWKYVPKEKEQISPEIKDKIKKFFNKDIDFFDNIEDFIPPSVLIN